VKGSEARLITFIKCVVQVRGIDTKVRLRLNVRTRWNSTFLMLESGFKYRRPFGSSIIRDRNFKHCLTIEEWKRAKKMCEFLRPFYKITNFILGTSYPTSNEYFIQVWKIEWLLRDTLRNDDPLMKDMANRMMNKFDKYWSEYSTILSIAMILDPQMKLEALRFYYSKLDPSTCDKKLNHIKGKMYKLFEEYVSVRSNSPNASSSQLTCSPKERLNMEEDLRDWSI